MEIIDRIFQLMNNKNLTANALEVKAKLSNASILACKKGKAKPSAEALCKIADYFGVSVDYLMGRETPSQEPLFALLSEENRNKVNSLAESLLKAQNGTEPLKLNDELTLLINELFVEKRKLRYIRIYKKIEKSL